MSVLVGGRGEKGEVRVRTFEDCDAGADDAESGVRGHGVAGAPASCLFSCQYLVEDEVS